MVLQDEEAPVRGELLELVLSQWENILVDQSAWEEGAKGSMWNHDKGGNKIMEKLHNERLRNLRGPV